MSNHRFDVFGREVLVLREQDHWTAYYIGTDGKRRSAKDIVIPASIAETELKQYLADLFHECASEERPDVRRLN
jgi:hypothetical protein